MSIPVTALKYGWSVLAILTIGTGTIFVAPVVLNRITLKDRIEVTLAVVERCMATQTGTNAQGQPVYAVAPPSIVRTWTDTNGASVTMTNALEWRDDLSMKVALDAKIFAVIPYYVDTNFVYDGTTNIVMLTVTGLFANLQIGNHTNQFTAIPAIGTNAATFGPWAWRNYIVAWQERYKVLNALKYTKQGSVTMTNDGITYPVGEYTNYGPIATMWPTVVWANRNGYRAGDIAYTYLENGVGGWSMEKGRGKAKFTILFNPSNLLEKTTIYLYVTGFNYPGQLERYDSFEAPAAEDSYVEIYSTSETTIGTVVVTPDFVGDSLAILPNTSDKWIGGISLSGWSAVGVLVQTWKFNYCTDSGAF